MSKVEFNWQPPEVMSVIRGCSKSKDCHLQDDTVGARLSADAQQLQQGEEYSDNGLTIHIMNETRITFAGHCSPNVMSNCVLRGIFLPTTESMAAAQERGLATQAQKDETTLQ